MMQIRLEALVMHAGATRPLPGVKSYDQVRVVGFDVAGTLWVAILEPERSEPVR